MTLPAFSLPWLAVKNKSENSLYYFMGLKNGCI